MEAFRFYILAIYNWEYSLVGREMQFVEDKNKRGYVYISRDGQQMRIMIAEDKESEYMTLTKFQSANRAAVQVSSLPHPGP